MMDCQQLYDNFLYRDSNDQPFNKLVCFYLPQEYNIPSIFQKSNNIETGKIVKYVRHMYDGLVPTIKETRTYNNSIYLEFVKFPSNAELSMHNVIWKHLCDKQSLIGSINDVRQPINILMLSHMTFDWFLCQTSLAHVQYLESYTGRIYCSDELISKILPKDIVISYPDIVKYIPFNTITHLLFGDKHLVKGLLSKKEQRTIILVLLEKYAHDLYRWVRDMNTLFSDLQQYLNISPLTLMTIKNQGGYN
jgi:hypothetical protein